MELNMDNKEIAEFKADIKTILKALQTALKIISESKEQMGCLSFNNKRLYKASK